MLDDEEAKIYQGPVDITMTHVWSRVLAVMKYNLDQIKSKDTNDRIPAALAYKFRMSRETKKAIKAALTRTRTRKMEFTALNVKNKTRKLLDEERLKRKFHIPYAAG